MKRIFILCSLFLLSGCAELQQMVNNLPQTTGGFGVSNIDIANALRQALDNGIDKQVTKLTQKRRFFIVTNWSKSCCHRNCEKVDRALRDVGLSKLADEGLKVINRAAEDAVKEATPIFANAVKQLTFADARKILLGNNNAATTYLKNKTNTALYTKFNPVINRSFSKVGANKIWSSIINKYNALPLTNNVNPDLTDYVTREALKGVYTMIAVEEKEIRTKVSSRTTDLMRRVFALQD